MENFRRLGQQLRDLWGTMGAVVRFLLIASALVAVSVLAVFLYTAYSSQPSANLRAVYSNLTLDEASLLKERLDALRYNAMVSSDGTAVLVAADRVGQARIDLASQGLPSQSKGYEILDAPTLSSTPFRDSVNYLRAKQTEIANSIQHLEPVARARVEIARPEPSPFVREQRPTTASILVTLKPGALLNAGQVRGIVAFVTRAVDGLTPENVSVVDQRGQLLSQTNSDVGDASNHLDYRRNLETYLANKAESILTKMLGPGRAVVHVSADINFKRLRETRETYNPEAKVVKMEKTTSSNSTSNGGPGARGVVGASSNLATRQAGAAGAGGAGTSTSRDETTETQYEVSRTRQDLEDGMGSIERLSIAATVDLTAPEGSSAQALTKAEIERLIRQAVGFRQDRGDEMQVSESKLLGLVPPTTPGEPSPPPAPTPMTRSEQLQMIQDYVDIASKVSLGLAVALLAVVVAMVLLRMSRQTPTEQPAAPGAVAQTARDRVSERLASAARRDPEALARALSILMERP